MTDVLEPSYRLYAFVKADDGSDADLRREGLPGWKLEKAVNWAFRRGVDTVLIERAEEPFRGRRNVTHHLCRDPGCPGGCS